MADAGKYPGMWEGCASIWAARRCRKKGWRTGPEEMGGRSWIGGQYLTTEVPAGVEWDDPRNRLIWTSGPLAGSGVSGAATFNVTPKGP